MVIVLSADATPAAVQQVLELLAEQGCRGELTVGVERTIITVVGPISPALQEDVRVLPHVDGVVPIGKPYRLASRLSNPAGTVVQVGAVAIGDGSVHGAGGAGDGGVGGADRERDGAADAAGRGIAVGRRAAARAVAVRVSRDGGGGAAAPGGGGTAPRAAGGQRRADGRGH